LGEQERVGGVANSPDGNKECLSAIRRCRTDDAPDNDADSLEYPDLFAQFQSSWQVPAKRKAWISASSSAFPAAASSVKASADDCQPLLRFLLSEFDRSSLGAVFLKRQSASHDGQCQVNERFLHVDHVQSRGLNVGHAELIGISVEPLCSIRTRHLRRLRHCRPMLALARSNQRGSDSNEARSGSSGSGLAEMDGDMRPMLRRRPKRAVGDSNKFSAARMPCKGAMRRTPPCIWGRSRVVLDISSAYAGSFRSRQEPGGPDCQLQLEWVYGSRGSDCRNNLIYLESSGELVYFMAAVVYTRTAIPCLATGQSSGHRKVQGKAHIRTLHVIGEQDFQRAVCCVAFSSYDKGELLCAVDEANDHHLSVWDWKAEKRLCQAKASKEPIMDVEFNPQEPNAIVSCGRGQISFWTIDDARNLEAKRGTFKLSHKKTQKLLNPAHCTNRNVQQRDMWPVFPCFKQSMNGGSACSAPNSNPKNWRYPLDKEAPKYILGLAFSPKGFLVSGDSSGNILIWDKGRNKITRELSGAHSDAVFSLTFLRDGRLRGGRAGRLVLWDDSCQRKLMDTEVPMAYGAVRCIVQGKGERLYLETIKNCVLEGSFSDGFSPISVVKQGAHCCSMSPDGNLAIVGSQTGHYIVLDAANRGAVLQTKKISREQIEDIKFSPDGQHVALASRNNKIYIYRVSSNNRQLDLVAKCQGHTSFVTHIDWSADGTLLRSNSGDYELLYWKMPDGQREFDDSVTRDAKWQTGTCCLSFEVAGIWRDANDGTDVNAVCVDAGGTLCAVGDDFGWVNLYSYPCPVAAPDRRQGGGHSSHVTNVAFTPDGKRLISCGGRDMAVMQWLLV
uniref:HELP domain-containing protein n=1 Tax=Macrostomum lignano TaxID=282301 RepID=A0A1I8FHG0_9PLAT